MQRKWSFITAILLAVLLAGCSKTEAPEITSIEQLNDRTYSVGVGEGAAGMFAVEDYLPDRVADFCRRLTRMGIPLAFEEP